MSTKEANDPYHDRKQAVLALLTTEELLQLGWFPGEFSQKISMCRSFLLSIAESERKRLEVDGVILDIAEVSSTAKVTNEKP